MPHIRSEYPRRAPRRHRLRVVPPAAATITLVLSAGQFPRLAVVALVVSAWVVAGVLLATGDSLATRVVLWRQERRADRAIERRIGLYLVPSDPTKGAAA